MNCHVDGGYGLTSRSRMIYDGTCQNSIAHGIRFSEQDLGIDADNLLVRRTPHDPIGRIGGGEGECSAQLVVQSFVVADVDRYFSQILLNSGGRLKDTNRVIG